MPYKDKEKRAAYAREWRKKNRDKVRLYKKVWNADGAKKWHRAYYAKYPWKKFYKYVSWRCKYDPDYIKKGIRCLITPEEIKILWFKYSAIELKRPSINRIDNDWHYTIGNCEFIELSENIALGNKSRKAAKKRRC